MHIASRKIIMWTIQHMMIIAIPIILIIVRFIEADLVEDVI